MLRISKAWMIKVYEDTHAHSYLRKFGQNSQLRVALDYFYRTVPWTLIRRIAGGGVHILNQSGNK